MRRRFNSSPSRTPDSLGGFAVSLIQSLGGRPTARGSKLFSAWAQREGGWTHNAATYNPLNLTAPGSGLPTINSVGVVSMPNEQMGVARTAKLLRSGYPALAQALRTGQFNFQDPAIQADLNRWVSGNRTPGMSQYVRGIASSFGSALPMPAAGPPMVTGGATPTAAPRYFRPPPTFDPGLMGRRIMQQFAQGGGRMDLSKLSGIVQTSFKQSPLKALPPEVAQAKGIVSPGGSLQDPAGANANLAVKAASTQIGKPYVFGSGPSTASFDCSDLIQWSYKQMGIQLPRTTFQQVKVGRPVTGPLQPGDLVFYAGSDGTVSNPGHVVMYAGNGKVVAAPHTGTVVQYQDLASLGKPVAVRRILR